MKKIIITILSALMIFSLTACSASQEGVVSHSASSNSNEAAVLNLPEEFKPFECSAEDEINYECSVDGNRFTFENGSLFVTASDNQKSEIFKTNTELEPVAYINNALYLSTVEDIEADNGSAINEQRLYRIVIDKNGNYDESSFSLVFGGLAVPSFITESNVMILNCAEGQDIIYRSLNTSTGEINDLLDAEYNIRADLPNGYITAEEAERIALEEAKNSKYYNNSAKYSFTPASEKASETGKEGTTLWKNIDFSSNYVQWGRSFNYYSAIKNDIKSYQYEKSPEYCWEVVLDAEPLTDGAPYPEVIVYVNAKTRGVSFVTVIPDLEKYNNLSA